MILSSLYISDSGAKGRGVYTDKFIEAGTIVEVAPVIVIPPSQKKMIDDTVLYDYYFNWSEDGESIAIALGYASVYNHSFTPNCRYLTYYEDKKIEVVAIKDIEPGEELTFNYNWDPDSQNELWFNTL